MSRPVQTCRLPGCEGRHNGRGLCGNHYAVAVRSGVWPELPPDDEPTISEKVAFGLALEPTIDRERDGIPQGVWTQDVVGAAIGMSGCNYARARAVVVAAEREPETFGHFVERMDATGFVQAVWLEWREVKNARPDIFKSSYGTVTWKAYERFVSGISFPPGLDGCWEWNRSLCNGYGNFALARVPFRSHRLAYEMWVGPIPEGLTLDHLCRNRKCVNPQHLEPCSRGENTLRGDTITGKNLRKTHCIHGHAFDEKNTIWTVDSGGRRRACRECQKQRAVHYRRARQAVAS